jgi:hypothetical protein
LSGTGAPVALVKRSGFDMINSHFAEVLYGRVTKSIISVWKGFTQNGWLLLARSNGRREI